MHALLADPILTCSRLFIAGVLGFAAIGKLLSGTLGVGIALAGAELGLAILVVFGVWTRWAGAICALAGGAFLLWNLGSAVVGHDSCECFGYFTLPIGWTLLADAGLIVCGCAVLRKSGGSSRPQTRHELLAIGAGSLATVATLAAMAALVSAKPFEQQMIGTLVPPTLERQMFGLQHGVYCPPQYSIFIFHPRCPECMALFRKVHNEAVRRERARESPLIRIENWHTGRDSPREFTQDRPSRHLQMTDGELQSYWPRVRLPPAVLIVVADHQITDVFTGKGIEKRLFPISK